MSNFRGLIVAAISMITAMATAQSIIPRPVTLKAAKGSVALTARSRICASGSARRVAEIARGQLVPGTGFEWPIVTRPADGDVVLKIDRGLSRLGPEGYRLNSTGGRVEISASAEAGLFYGLQSLRQLLPPAILRRAAIGTQDWTVPAVEIEDQPRFGWRGAHLDPCRHFRPKEFVLKFIDVMALHKLNKLHFHLTDDQGWRIEIKKYPKLTEVGAWRDRTMAGAYSEQRFDSEPHGGFYTQEDLREIVAYAKARFIEVVPEIEMPGHALAALAAYPELGNGTGPYKVGDRWGVIKQVFNAEDSTIQFLQNVLTEVLEIFPSPFIHVGGDECPKDEWKASARAQELIKERGLKNEDELQSWFIHQMDKWLAQHGRRLVGWDEILEGGLAPGATVMSWRGEAGGIAAAKAGHDVIMTPGNWTYFDHYQGDPVTEPLAIGGRTDLAEAYGYDPVPPSLTPEEAKHVLGTQGQLWSEYFPTTRYVEYMAFPRLCALSEIAWTPRDQKDFKDFEKRLPEHLKRLDAMDVNYRKLDGSNARYNGVPRKQGS